MLRIYVLGCALLSAFISLPAFAHAHLDHATPAVRGTVAAAPKDVTLSFTEAVEPKFSSIVVLDSRGAAVQDGVARGVPGNTTQLRIAVKPLPPGTYTVMWKAVSVDTHRTQGEFQFTVRP